MSLKMTITKTNIGNKTVLRAVCTILLFSCVSLFAQADESDTVIALISADNSVLPQHDKYEHLGVASCAASMCHGSVIPRQGSKVLQNEYIVWSRQDAHAQAYQTLLNPASKRIANNLGLKNAHEAKICLDCHADNAEHRGERFQINDGIGCEACHGGAEKYISSHTDNNIARSENIASGLVPLDQPLVRAKVCLSCHLGTKDKFASHDIMGAGHPRLSFELDTFSLLQPLHYVVDKDYQERKWAGGSYLTWVYGQLAASQQSLQLISEKIAANSELFPELALFDCHACHHSMDDIAWTKNKGRGAKPGTVRLNDGNLLMLLAISENTALKEQLHKSVSKIAIASNNKALLLSSVTKLTDEITQLQKIIAQQSPQARQQHAAIVLKAILTMGSKGQFADYIAAEQSVMAIDLLLETLGKNKDFTNDIDELFVLVKNENKFNAQLFSQKIGNMAALF